MVPSRGATGKLPRTRGSRAALPTCPWNDRDTAALPLNEKTAAADRAAAAAYMKAQCQPPTIDAIALTRLSGCGQPAAPTSVRRQCCAQLLGRRPRASRRRAAGHHRHEAAQRMAGDAAVGDVNLAVQP